MNQVESYGILLELKIQLDRRERGYYHFLYFLYLEKLAVRGCASAEYNIKEKIFSKNISFIDDLKTIL